MKLTLINGRNRRNRRHEQHRKHQRRTVGLSTVAMLVLAAALTAGCGATDTAQGSSAGSGSRSGAGSTTYPLSIENCGRTLELPHAPQRVVSLWPSITEMLIALDASDRIAGQAFTDQSPPLPKYEDAFNEVKVLATNAVSREVLLSARPDLIVADGEYHFNGKELPTIESLAELGIPVYIISSFCDGAVTTGRVSDIDTDLTALGSILDAGDRASELKNQLRDQLATATAQVADEPSVPLVLCQIYDGAIYAEAEGLYSDVVTRAGGTNLFDGQLPDGQYYAQVSAEVIARKDPGTIVYLYNSDEEKASTLAFLKESFPTVDAVRNDRLIALPSTDFIDMRAVDGVVALADALHPAG